VKIQMILDSVEKEQLKEKHSGHELFSTHIRSVIDKTHCYLVELFAIDFDYIKILSCVPDPDHNPISKTVGYIKAEKNFFESQKQICLRRNKVRDYKKLLDSCAEDLPKCFTVLGDCFVLYEDGIFRVTDGMHRLVAYGLACNMDESQFPIPAYLGSTNSLELGRLESI
jgi:hypothetical protein